MKISHADHDELKTKKDPLEKYFSVFSVQILRLMLPFLRLP